MRLADKIVEELPEHIKFIFTPTEPLMHYLEQLCAEEHVPVTPGVLALVEIKAGFDEQDNISWARKLEQAGVHVVYGIVGLKMDCKISLVVRQYDDWLRRAVHVGTGNYHPFAVPFYELLVPPSSCGASKTTFRGLLMAPRTVLGRFLPVPGALPGLRVLQRRGAAHLHRLGGHDAPGPGPPGGDVVRTSWTPLSGVGLLKMTTLPMTAYREVSEEIIGLLSRLNLPTIRYGVKDGVKDVHYWAAEFGPGTPRPFP